MGAAGRDFHDLQTFFREHPQFRVCCFTAEQIPYIDARNFPSALAGDDYDDDIPIHPESELEALITKYDAELVFLSYSDLAHEDVMHKACRVQAAGASFSLLGPNHVQLESTLPVVSVTAVRTGAGKSPLSQAIAHHMKNAGIRLGVLRHPMPYGDLAKQAVQRFATVEDLDAHNCTIEEREEYEPYVSAGLVIYAGVDYRSILRAAEKESDAILWDGGNNDIPFVKPGLHIVVADALRPGHEVTYYPGEVNVRSADVVLVNKIGEAPAEDAKRVRDTIAALNPTADIIDSDLELTLDNPGALEGKRAVVIEDGPTLTHGGMSFGAGLLAAKRSGVSCVVKPKEFAVGSIARAYEAYPQMEDIVPALGYSEEQLSDLSETIRACKPDVVVDASPARLDRLIEVDVPIVRVGYRFAQRSGPPLLDRVLSFVKED